MDSSNLWSIIPLLVEKFRSEQKSEWGVTPEPLQWNICLLCSWASASLHLSRGAWRWNSRVSCSSSAPLDLLSFLSWSGHLQEAVLVKPEEPPALLLRQVLRPAALVELHGRGVVLRHHKHHAGAARLHRQLDQEQEKETFKCIDYIKLKVSLKINSSWGVLLQQESNSRHWGVAGSLSPSPVLKETKQEFRDVQEPREDRRNRSHLCTRSSQRTPPGRAACQPRGHRWSSTWQNPPP